MSVDLKNSTVTVHAPGRLHLGFMDLHGGLGRRFGSLGLALDGPATKVTVRPAARLVARGATAERARQHAHTLIQRFDLPPVDIEVDEAIPSHAGLGSGTQLALATGLAMSHLFSLELEPAVIADLLDRGARSGIGLGAFQRGGFLIDGGRGSDGALPPLTCHMAFPEHWRVVLVQDQEGQGVHGQDEVDAFAILPKFPAEHAGELCRIVLMQALPAIAESNIGDFGRAISRLQEVVGDHFAPVQGGRFMSKDVEGALLWLSERGAAGFGQSSWGPTGFALFDSETAACRALQGKRTEDSRSVNFRICRPRNRGATINVVDRDTANRDASREDMRAADAKH